MDAAQSSPHGACCYMGVIDVVVVLAASAPKAYSKVALGSGNTLSVSEVRALRGGE